MRCASNVLALVHLGQSDEINTTLADTIAYLKPCAIETQARVFCPIGDVIQFGNSA
jgi:hypothetical protein